MKEDINVEFKELDRNKGTLPDSVPKEIVAFSNTEGGTLFIGIRDDGTVVGVDNSDDVMTRVSNVAHDTILPDIMPFIQIRSVELEGKQVIKITVSVGTERPYYLAKEGLRPKGVYVRRGTACIPLNEAGIREMIMETSGKSYEESRSLNQELTFETLKAEMSLRSIEFATPQMSTLKMIGSDGLFTNLALLLSDQCPHTIKVAVFQGSDNAVFRERKEFSGSLLKQLNDVYAFLDFYNKTKATFEGLRRSDQRDYPEDALREALLNSIIHRDYLFSGSTIINMFDDHVEFISLGGLVRGISMEAIFMGVSQSRNPNLAAVFYRLGLVESYGTGVRKIIRLYKNPQQAYYSAHANGSEPKFRAAEGAFTVELPNRNEIVATQNAVNAESTGDTRIAKSTSAVSEDAAEGNGNLGDSIYALAQEKGKITRKEVEEVYGIGSTKAFNILKKLCDEGLLTQQKKGYQTVYTLSTKLTSES